MIAFRALGSFTLSTALVATAAAVVIVVTTPAHAASAPLAVHAAPSALQLRQLAADVQGSYTLADGRTLRVWREASAMRAQIDDDAVLMLAADGPARLRTADGRTTLSFRTAPDGRAYAVSVALSR